VSLSDPAPNLLDHADDDERVRPRAFTARSVLASLGILVLMSWAVPYNDYYLRGTFLTGNHFPLGAVLVLTILILALNPFLGLFSPRARFSSRELVVIWSVLIVCSGIPSSGLSRYFYSLLVGPAYYADNANRWGEYLLPYLHDWLVPSKDGESDVVRYFFEKLPDEEPLPWAAWKRPLLCWSVYIFCFYVMMWCLCVILRKQWVERERLNFPLIYLPLEMAATPEKGRRLNSFFRSNYTWVGVLIPIFIHLVNGLHAYFSWVPTFTLRIPLRPLLTDVPWSAMQVDSMYIYLSAVAFAFLIPVDVSLSLWFFYLFLQTEYVVCAAAGKPLGGDWDAFAVHQQAGAFLVLAVLLVWRARRHLIDVGRKAFLGDRKVDDSREAMSYRTAVFGLILSVGVMAGWCAFFGMSLGFSLLAIFFMIAILVALTRLIAQGGLLFIYQNFCPNDILTTTFGGGVVGPATLGLLAIQNVVFIHDAREVMMPSSLNAIHLTDSAKGSSRRLMLLIVPAVVLCVICSGYFFLKQTYQIGGANLDWFGMRTVFWFKLRPWVRVIQTGEGTNWTNIQYLGIGGVLMTFTFVMGLRFHWWLFHPLGILMANSYAMRHFWFSILLGWAFKKGIMSFGGGGTYKRMRYFFMGMVVGECMIGGIWVLVGFITGKPTNITILPP